MTDTSLIPTIDLANSAFYTNGQPRSANEVLDAFGISSTTAAQPATSLSDIVTSVSNALGQVSTQVGAISAAKSALQLQQVRDATALAAAKNQLASVSAGNALNSLKTLSTTDKLMLGIGVVGIVIALAQLKK